MQWNVAQAKQRLSELIREAAHEPQIIYNRKQPVAAVIAAQELADYRAWKAASCVQPRKTLGQEFDELRQLLIEEGLRDGLDIPPRLDRPNAFVQMIEEEHPELLPPEMRPATS